MMKGLKGCIWERRKGVTSLARLGVLSLFQLLVGLEACARKAWLGGGGGGGGEERVFFDSRGRTCKEMGYRTREC